jgi:hypothetical protein
LVFWIFEFDEVEILYLDSDPEENRTRVLDTLFDFSNQYPQAAVPRRLALTIATGEHLSILCRNWREFSESLKGETFKELVTPYLLSGLTRGVPSLFSDVKSLYNDDHKRQVIEEIVEAAKERFDPGMTFNITHDTETLT